FGFTWFSRRISAQISPEIFATIFLGGTSDFTRNPQGERGVGEEAEFRIAVAGGSRVMKTIFRFLSTGVLTAAIVAVAATAGFGQDAAATPNPACADIDGHNALYTKFTAIFQKKTVAEMQTALSTGKEYLEKYGSCTEAFKEQIDYVRPHVVRLEKEIPAAVDREKLAPFFKQFDEGLAAGNADAVLAAG